MSFEFSGNVVVVVGFECGGWCGWDGIGDLDDGQWVVVVVVVIR